MLRFRLRTLMLLNLVVAVPLAWKVNHLRNQRQLVADLRQLKYYVTYDYQGDKSKVTAEPHGPRWLRRWLGDDFFSDVIDLRINVGDEQSMKCDDNLLSRVSTLFSLKRLDIGPASVTDAGLAHLRRLSHLEWLNVASDQITDAGLSHLAALSDLQELHLPDNAKITAHGIGFLNGAVQLRCLGLHGCAEIDDAALALIGKQTTLQALHIQGTRVTDAGLESLCGLRSLKFLNVVGTRVAPSGVEKLQQALPGCRVRTKHVIVF